MKEITITLTLKEIARLLDYREYELIECNECEDITDKNLYKKLENCFRENAKGKSVQVAWPEPKFGYTGGTK